MSGESTEELLQELVEVSKQNQRWLRLLALDQAKETVSTALSEPWEYHVYEDLDGQSSLGDLAEGLDPSDSTVGRRLKRWKQLGIVEQTSSGQYDKIVSLDLLGINVPELDEGEDE
jgi:hypothetical protein